RSEISDRESTIVSQKEEISDLENEMNELQEMLSVMDSRQLHVVRLLGMEANPFGYGNVIWDSQNNRAVVQLAELPDAGKDGQYQFWAIFDNKAVDIRSFSVNNDGEALFSIDSDSLDGLDRSKDFSFAVTLEFGGGSSQPDGEMHLMGSFDGQ
ncbi:MAG: hypothetical protein GWN00_22700, partial [Aliifodinibius sp.]|nr:anti-sigma factor [Fodinibius sp.]NIV13738.1 hypothetical protein [Fodinibius sp.]NIY27510.1 hypothetical protein [Fodinibius sp.]